MRIGSRLFPYPVVNNDKSLSTFNETEFEVNYEVNQTDDHVVLKNIFYSLDNRYLNELIASGEIEVVTIVECSYTVYRKIFKISDSPEDIEIPLQNLRDKVVISSYAYAVEDIYEFKDYFFDEDFADYSFNIEKNSIIAIDDGVTTKIVYEEEDDNKISSIFLVLKSSDEELDSIEVDLTPRKIQITLRESEYGIYDNMKDNDNLNNIFFSYFIIPALIYAIEKLKKDGDFESIPFSYDWFSSIQNTYQDKTGKELNEEEFSSISSLEIAQIVMGNPITKAVNDLFAIAINNNNGGDDDE